LKVLQNVPEIDKTFLDFSALVDERNIASYVAEAKEWIEQIRPLLIQITSPAPQPSPSLNHRTSSIEDGQISEDGIPKKRRRSSPERPPTILERFAAVEERVREMADEVQVHRQHVDHVIKDEVERISITRFEEMRQANGGGSKSLDPVERLSTKDNESGQTVANQAEKIAFLLTRQRAADVKQNALVEQNKTLIEMQACVCYIFLCSMISEN
jgi:hypothetical protein